MDGRRWDIDERGHGVASGDEFSPNVEELAVAMRRAGWVTEEPEAHLLPHLEAASSGPGSPWEIVSWTIDDGVFAVEATWNGPWGTSPPRQAGIVRTDVSARRFCVRLARGATGRSPRWRRPT
jgi:hypothetical protein